MKRGARGFTELVEVIPGEVIAALEAVMASNFMHGAAADDLLHLRGASISKPTACRLLLRPGEEWNATSMGYLLA